MSENIFENAERDGVRFCMRGDELKRPVEWAWLKTSGDQCPVFYVNPVTSNSHSVCVNGQYVPSEEGYMDLIPIPPRYSVVDDGYIRGIVDSEKPGECEPVLVPWDSPGDVPDGVWFRKTADPGSPFREQIDCIDSNGDIHLTAFGHTPYHVLFQVYEYHTDRRAKTGWQPCGKVAQG